MFKYIPAALMATTLFFGVGCGDDDDDSGVSGEQIDFTHEMAKAICLSGRNCCEKDDLDIHDFCIKEYEIELADMVPPEPMDTVQWDASAATRCIEAMRTLYSKCTYDDQDIEAASEACTYSKLGRGTVKKGQPCTYSIECEGEGDIGGACLDTSSWGGTSGNACFQVKIMKEGESCSNESALAFVYALCDEELYCDNSGSEPVCAKAPKEGESCLGSCAKGFYCHYPPDFSSQPVCKKQNTSGSCENDIECVYECVEGKCSSSYRTSNADSMCEDSAQTGGAP